MRCTLLTLFFAFQTISTFSQTNNLKIIPEPYTIKLEDNYYLLPNKFVVVIPVEFKLDDILLGDWANPNQIGGKDYRIQTNIYEPVKDVIFVKKDTSITEAEEYKLKVGEDGILIYAMHENGVFYAFKTLQQLMQSFASEEVTQIPFVEIHDKPRYGYRGLMLDPARHFLPIEDLKSYIDVMSYYKFNRLHLHLTDNQGWRIEIKEYPRLVEVASKRKETDGNRKPHEGYYSRADLEELVRFAQSRFVEIIPEIDMPGHNQAAMAAYPNLACFPDSFEVRTTPGQSIDIMCAGNEEVYNFYATVLKEVSEIFPYPSIHIGGDEAPLTRWEECPHCQRLIQEKGHENEEELMSHFFERIKGILSGYGKKPVFWHESIVSNYPTDGTVFLWKNMNPEKVMNSIRNSGLKMINSYSENAYFDYPQWEGDGPFTRWMPILPLEKAYNFKPSFGLSDKEDDFILGVEGCLWGEYMPNINKVFYMSYPRALALSEAGWTTKDNRSWENFKEKLPKHLFHLLSNGILFRPPVELYNH